MNKTDQRSRTRFFVKYGDLYLYDIDLTTIYTIENEEILFVKGYVYDLFDNTYHPYGSSTYHEYFLIHDD